MSSQAHADRLAKALDSTSLAQTVRTWSADNRVNVLCRILPGMDAKWTDLLENMLIAEKAQRGEAYAWQAHICRHYFLKEDKGKDKLVFGWNISVQSNDMTTSLDFLIRVIQGGDPNPVRNEPGETMEMPLVGARPDRNQGPGGKGAYTLGGKNDFRPPVRR